MAQAVALGFQREVENMNRGIEDRLDRIVKFENAKKEKAYKMELKR